MVAKTDLPARAAFDVGITQDLRNQFRTNPQAGLKAAAQQFEAMFLQMMLKSMRDAVPQGGMLDSEQSRFYTGMLDQQLAQNLSKEGSLGLAKMMERQMAGQFAAAGQGADGTQQGAAATLTHAGAPSAAAPMPLETLLGNVRNHMATLRPERELANANGAGMAIQGNRAANHARNPQAISPEGQKMNATTSSTVPASAKEFVNRVWPHAVEASRTTGIPPQFLVAHAALESNWGRNEPRRTDGSPSHNLFGIKAGKSWQGEAVTASTTEFSAGQAQRVREPFRAYASYADSFRDYASLLRNNPRYSTVIGSQDGTEFAKRLQQAGYATDPQYASKLASIINGPTLRQALIG